jgi:hypothetical protein
VLTVLRERFRRVALQTLQMSVIPVRKAVIPIAGWGTRMFPASKAVPKALFPMVDKVRNLSIFVVPMLVKHVKSASSRFVSVSTAVFVLSPVNEFEQFFLLHV